MTFVRNQDFSCYRIFTMRQTVPERQSPPRGTSFSVSCRSRSVAVALALEHPVDPPDQVVEGHRSAADGQRKPAVETDVAMVAHHEILARRYHDLRRVVARVLANIQYGMRRAPGKGLDVAPLPQVSPILEGLFSQSGSAPDLPFGS